MAKAGLVYIGTADGLVILSDPGATGRWRKIGHELVGQAVQAIAAETALAVLVATPLGVLRSNDGGQTWNPAPEAEPPTAPVTEVTLLGNPPVQLRTVPMPDYLGIERRVNDELLWEGIALPAAQVANISVLALAHYHRDVVWAGTDAGEVLRSDDRGRTWELVIDGLAAILSLAAVRLM